MVSFNNLNGIFIATFVILWYTVLEEDTEKVIFIDAQCYDDADLKFHTIHSKQPFLTKRLFWRLIEITKFENLRLLNIR